MRLSNVRETGEWANTDVVHEAVESVGLLDWCLDDVPAALNPADMAWGRDIALAAHLVNNAVDVRGVTAVDRDQSAGGTEHLSGAASNPGRAAGDEYALSGHVHETYLSLPLGRPVYADAWHATENADRR